MDREPEDAAHKTEATMTALPRMRMKISGSSIGEISASIASPAAGRTSHTPELTARTARTI